MKNPCKYSFFPQMKWFLLQGNLVPELELLWVVHQWLYGCLRIRKLVL